MQSLWQCICFAILAVESENIAGRRHNDLWGFVLHQADLLCGLIIKGMTSLINISNAKVITSASAFNFHQLTAEKVCSVAQR